MDLTINWLTDLWSTFSLWTSTQPTFVQVAFGMGLFYGVWLFLRLLYRVVYLGVSGLFAFGGRAKVKKGYKAPNHPEKHVTLHDNAPPFLFR